MKILVTGGSGALGQELARSGNLAERWVTYSRGEHKQLSMAAKFDVTTTGESIYGDDSPYRFFIGDVRDKDRLRVAMGGITHVIHAAALKVVPTGEYNPMEFVKTNILGAQNVVDVALECGVEKVIGISTDKACSPVNLYGATKLAAEKIFTAANAYGGVRTRFSSVRYGNVTGSTGSVVPLWHKCALAGDPLPITDPDMTRFWMTLEDAASFVMGCMESMEGGEVFIPKLEAYRVGDLAHAMGGSRGGTKIIGMRPGEKLHESMVSPDESHFCYESPGHLKLDNASGSELWSKVAPGYSYASDTAPLMDVGTLESRMEHIFE